MFVADPDTSERLSVISQQGSGCDVRISVSVFLHLYLLSRITEELTYQKNHCL